MARRRKEALPDYAALPTEADNPRSEFLDTLPPDDVVKLMLDEESNAIKAVKARSELVAKGARLIADTLAKGGRMIYVGAGTSGRLGNLDAAECVPTFGIPPSLVEAIVAGGSRALVKSVEGAEDDTREAEQRCKRIGVGPKDVVICIAASGVTPFVRSALEYAHGRRAATIFITCGRTVTYDDGTPIADVVIELATGPEVISGSTRLKAGTATKVTLNALSTTAFVLLGKTYGGLMVDVRPTNTKLWARATRIVQRLTGLPEADALALIKKAGGRAKVALVMHHAHVNALKAKELLVQHRGSLRAIVGDLDSHS
ncbi:MAG: N-acetylmuramic acid 6-phosphate etherase [Deltaproteobacteria bacterium]|nr:N-acetylmuramic acid 6-phosphate etherase [Deltaproteobacteria bacterium]